MVISGIPQVLPADLTRRCCSDSSAEDVLGSCQELEKHSRRPRSRAWELCPGCRAAPGKPEPCASPRAGSPGRGITQGTLSPRNPWESLPPAQVSPQSIQQLPDPADQRAGHRHRAHLTSSHSSDFRGVFHPMKGIEACFSLPILLLQKKKKNPPHHRILLLLRTWG